MADEQFLTWKLSDPGMDILERAGLAGLYMSLRAAEEKERDLSPLRWELTSDSVTIRWTDPARPGFEKLMEWAWQVTKDGVLFLPGVHDEFERANFYLRVPTHTGIMRTFLQHTNVQPKGEPIQKIVRLDETREISVSYQPPIVRLTKAEDGEITPAASKKLLKPSRDISDLFDRKGQFRLGSIELSNWVCPGIAGRYGGEGAWMGNPERALILMLAPTVCLFQRLQGEGGNWVFVIPDVRDLSDFATTRKRMSLNADFVDVASMGDAGLQFFAKYATGKPRQSLGGCRVVAMGKVVYYASQSIRKAVLDVIADEDQLKRYRLLHHHFQNSYVARRIEEEKPDAATNDKRNSKVKKKANDEPPKAAGFFKLPSARGRIADNLVNCRPWYENLTVPQKWDLEDLERQRKKSPGKSIERLWFEAICYQRSKLMKLIKDDVMWDSEAEKVFVEAFWEALDCLYAQEAAATLRGGSRTVAERFEDLTNEIRRRLTQAKTRTLLRAVLADLFAKAGRQKTIRTHPAAVWRLIDNPNLWRKGHDLALLGLASHRKKEERDAFTTPTQGA